MRLALEGIAKIQGDVIERNEILEKDDNDVPKILTMIYHELFPTFFLLSKTLNVSCPPHTIGEMGDMPSQTLGAKDDVVEEVTDTPSESPSEPDELPKEILETPVTEEAPDVVENSDVVQPTV